ncbi:hypothetical protein ACA910_019900 [Epithemia clementina (nom. ined.)]
MTRATLKTPPLHVLRGIYRLLRTPPLPKELLKKGPPPTKPTAMQRLLLDRYRTTRDQLAETKQQELRKTMINYYRSLAVHYYNLKLDLRERDRLYKLDTGADMQLSAKELSRRAAARAGLQLPDLSGIDN